MIVVNISCLATGFISLIWFGASSLSLKLSNHLFAINSLIAKKNVPKASHGEPTGLILECLIENLQLMSLCKTIIYKTIRSEYSALLTIVV